MRLVVTHMCTAQSKPIKDTIGLSKPTIKAVPSEFQPPAFVNCVKTSRAFAVGASTHRVTTIAKRPSTCRTSKSPSTMGSLLAKTVLKMMAKVATAMTSSVPCQLWAT